MALKLVNSTICSPALQRKEVKMCLHYIYGYFCYRWVSILWWRLEYIFAFLLSIHVLCSRTWKATNDPVADLEFWKGSTTLWGPVPEVATPLLCWCHSGPVWRTQLQRRALSLFYLLSSPASALQIIELRGEMEVLKFELSQLKAQLQPPRPQISSNEVVERYPPLSAEREAMPENSSWQPVGKKCMTPA